MLGYVGCREVVYVFSVVYERSVRFGNSIVVLWILILETGSVRGFSWIVVVLIGFFCVYIG